MKFNFLKNLLPAAAITLAIAGAFAAQDADAALVTKTGWVSVHSPCDQSLDCETEPRPQFCTLNVNGTNYRAYGKINPGDGSCPQTLYRIMNP